MNTSNTRTIARNAGWYGLENAIGFVVTLFTSIAIARTLGPTKMGYIIYVSWIAAVVSSLGGMGIPATTRKYMAEFLGKGDRGTARFIYFRTLQLQAALATLATAGLLFWVLRDAAGEYKLASALIVLSIWPAMVNFISAQANVATEELSTNLPASVISTFIFFIAVGATVVLKWGVVGFGASMLAMRLVDFLVRVFPTMKRILTWDTTHVHPLGLHRRMTTFAWQSVTSMIVALVVWDRSEFILLKYLCPDIRQVSYYSVAFSMAERLLVSSLIFGSATGATIFAQFGRDKSRLPELTSSSVRYLALTSVPLHFIASALAFPTLLVLYGSQYRGAAMVVTLAPLLCMPKAFIGPVQSLLQSTEKQSYVILATVLAGIVDMSVAWYLIPAHGAVGACIGSGAAQVVAVGLMWGVGMHLYKVKLPWLQIAKIVFISVLASLTAHYIAAQLAPLWGILCGGTASLIVLFGLIYLMRVLEPEDHDRFNILAGMLPKSIVRPAGKFLSLLTRPESGSVVTASRYPLPAEEGRISSMIMNACRRHLPKSVRERAWSLQRSYKGIALKRKLVPIRVDACLQGGDNGVSAATFARMIGDIRRASRPISEWPQVKLLREYDSVGERLWEQGVFERTDYYRNAVLNIELFGRYFDAVAPDQVQWGARRFVHAYLGLDGSLPSQVVPNYERDPYEYIAVHPVKDSTCYQVSEGHHRLALAYMQGVREVPGLILQPPVTTPVQELLLDVLWLKGRRELYQPIDSPEVAGWVLVRRCADRLAKMTELLRAEGLMPPASSSYLDVACSYGWFVSEMQKAGFQAEGVERDPSAISVGQTMYGLKPDQVHRSDVVSFLRKHQNGFDVTSCFSLAHHYILNRLNVSAEELLGLVDEATRRVMFFDMGQSHEYPGEKLDGWDPDHIHHWLEANTTFRRIVRLGGDEDAVPPNRRIFGRMLFACVR
ncbi:MAG: polysaccharide biosynthesis C-terminal domain-containing protein [Terracidiphilus sp.]|jgi:O-antigen/teichoic acid export membrane protein